MTTVTIFHKTGSAQVEANDPRVRAHDALAHAASRMGVSNARGQLAAHLKSGRSKSTFRFHVTDAHAEVVAAMPAVLAGNMTPEAAMGLLHDYNVLSERTRS
jgi:NADH:ubiquinone oxidoreductase subunit D